MFNGHIRKIAAGLLVLTMSICLSFPVSALSREGESDGLYVATPAIPSNVLRFAQTDFADHITAMIQNGDFTGDPYRVQLGTPFTYLGSEDSAKQFYFPVIYGGEFIYIYRIYEDTFYFEETGELRYAGTMSAVMVDAFSNLAKMTSQNSPATLVVDGYNIIAVVRGQVEVIAEAPFTHKEPSTNSEYEISTQSILAENDALEVINAADTIGYEKNFELPIATRSNPIALSITETQPNDESWCAAYVTAALIRTVQGVSLSASTITKYYGLNKNEGLSHGQAIDYAQAMYAMQPLYYESALSRNQVIDEIDHSCPIYASMRHNSTISHAVAICGYTSTKYTIWNPWYVDYETFSSSTLTYVPSTSTKSFYWNATIYNWQK